VSVNAPEDKRTAFIAQLATIAPSQRVYVAVFSGRVSVRKQQHDESGMDERDDYGYGWCESVSNRLRRSSLDEEESG